MQHATFGLYSDGLKKPSLLNFKSRIISYCIFLSLFASAGCSTTLQVTNNNGFHATGQEQSQHVNRWAWGRWNGSLYKPACANGLHDVTVTTTFGEKLLTVITLGIYCPVNVSWHCQEKDLTH